MKQLIVFLLLTFSCQLSFSQVDSLQLASSFFPKEKAKVLVVGTFHFDFPGLDAHKTPEEDKIDVLAEEKQKEVLALVEYIKKFKPTKIALEAYPSWNATDKLRKYKQGTMSLGRDEREQLGIRIAAEMNLDTLYSIDAGSMADDLVRIDSNYVKTLFLDYDFQNEDPLEENALSWLAYEDKMKKQVHLIDYFKMMNSRENHLYGYGIYLIGDFKLDNERGADVLSVWWYNRNMRIFRKIQQLTENTDDRILVIFGNGHACILRQLLECSPEFDFIEFDSLGK